MEKTPRKLQHAVIETLDFITAEMRARAPATPFAVEVGGKRYSGDAEFGVTDDGVFLIRFFDEKSAVHAGLSAAVKPPPIEEITGDGAAGGAAAGVSA